MLRLKTLPVHSTQLITKKQSSLDKILYSVQMGNCCRVLGPRFRSKSILMRDAMKTLRQHGTHHTSYQSLAVINSDNESRFFASLYEGIEMDVLPFYTTTIGQTIPESAFEFQHAMLNLIRQCDRNLAIFLDSLEIPPPNLIADLLGALRAIFTMVVDQPGAHFQAIVCGSLSLRQVALHSASRFESISDLVFVDDLDETERLYLVQRLLENSDVIPTAKGIQTFLDLTGGDPLLIEALAKLCFQQMKEVGKTRMTPARVTEASELLVKILPNQKVVDQFHQIENNPDILSATLKILEQGEVSSSELPIELTETPNQLDLCGVLRRTGYKYQIKCALWTRLLKNLLTEARVGRHYAIAGDWQKAFKFLGSAISKGHTDLILEVFAYTISAIYASQSTLEAFGHLALGLRATFSGSSIKLYYLIEDHLEMIYPLESGRERLPLSEVQHPEIKALSGPNYSITSTPSGKGYLIPLRSGDVYAAPIGLLSFIKHPPHDSPYYTREELVHMIGFLHQAAQTIETKIRLFSINHKAELQEQRAKITSGLIHDIYSAVANIPDLIDELEYQLAAGKEIETPLKDLRRQAYETDRVSKKLKDFVTSGKFEPKFVKIESLIEDILNAFQLNGSNTKLIHTKKGNSAEIWADELAIGLLIKNLVVNALEAIPQEREGKIIVHTDMDQNQEFLVITVSDNGEGIPPENIPKLFDFGYSTKKGNKMRGIGLFLCLQIAEAHHGKLSVESQLAVGTTFTLTLPNIMPSPVSNYI